MIIYTCQTIRTLSVYEAVQAGELCGEPVFKDVYSSDPVFNFRYVYEDGGWSSVGTPPDRPTPIDPARDSVPPECAMDCKWWKTFNFDIQQNALRLDAASIIEIYRCGWNLKPGVIGGHALDYAACTYHR
jgi:hypothetical protein